MNLLVINRKISKDRDWSFQNKVPFRYLLYWPIFLFLTLLALIGAWLYLNLSTPLYEVDAKILINSSEEGLKNVDAKRIISGEGQFANLLHNVVTDLHLYAPVYNEDSFKSTSAFTSSPIMVVAESGIIKASGKIHFTCSNTSITVNRKSYRLNEWINTSFARIKFVKNTHYIEDINQHKFYFYLIPSEKVVSSIALRLKVIADPKSPANITIGFTDEVPLRGEAIVKEFTNGCIKLIADQKKTFAVNKARLVDEQVAMVENDLLVIENKLLSSGLTKKTQNYDGKQHALLNNLHLNDLKIGEINTKLVSLNKVENGLQFKSLSGLTPSIEALGNPDIKQMSRQINQLQTQTERLRKTANNYSSVYTHHQKRIEKIKSQILTNLQSERKRLQANRNTLLRKNNSYLSVLVSKIEKPKPLVEVQKEHEIKKNQYVSLLKQKEELALSTVSNSTNNPLIDSVENYPINHNEKPVYLSAVFTAIIIAFGIAVKKETSDSRIMSEKDIESITRLPVVGTVAVEKSKKEVFGTNLRSTDTAQFRKLRAMLNYLMLDSKRKRILISSATAGEGKSFIAMNLAKNLALSEKKVALLDLSLKYTNSPNLINAGSKISEVAGYLEGISVIEKMITRTVVSNHLSLLTISGLPENFSTLVKNGKLSELLNYLDQDFDYTIIDTSTLYTLAEIGTLSALCDATLHVIKRGLTPKAVIERLDKESLSRAAIVFNGL